MTRWVVGTGRWIGDRFGRIALVERVGGCVGDGGICGC